MSSQQDGVAAGGRVEAPEGKDAAAATTRDRCGFPSCAREGTKQCTVCKTVLYCGVEHQRGHWKVHKVECKAFAASRGGDAAGGAGAAALEGKDAGEGGGGGDAGERTATEARCDMLGAKMKEDGFDIRTTRCGPNGPCALGFALGGEGEPYDEKAVKLALGMPGVDVNATDDTGQSLLWNQCYMGRSRSVKLLLTDPRVDPNLAEGLHGMTPLYFVSFKGMDRCVEALLSDPRVDPNIANTVNGNTPLHIAAEGGHDRCVEVLLADPRVDPNLCALDGATPLFIAASESSDGCVDLFLADKRIDVCRAASGQTPLLSACVQLMKSMDQVGVGGGNDPARTLVIMLKSRRIPKHNLEESIAFLFKFMPNRRQIHNAEVGGEPLQPAHKMTRLVLPVLMSQLKGDFRWCAHCLKLTPDVDLNRCGGCNQVGYCEEAPPGQKKPCHVLHWKAGHKQECARFAAEAEAEAKAEEEAAEAEAKAAEEERAAKGKGGGKGGAGGAGGAGGGGGGGKKKGRGKKKKGR
jgi:hypothetical protein